MSVGRFRIRGRWVGVTRIRGLVLRRMMRRPFNERAWAPDRRRIVALGDSHLEVIPRYVAPRVTAMFDIVQVWGATAQGLVNPNSSTDALRLFQARLDRAPRWQTVLLELGEVDCGFVIWYRAEKKGLTVDDQLEVSLGNYLGFIDRQVASGFDVWVMSAPLPTIGDAQDWGEVANLRRMVGATQSERTALTLRYNELLQQACLARRVRFIDVSSEQLDLATGIIKPEFVHSDRLNHHLDDSSWGDLIVRELISLPESELADSRLAPAVCRRRSGKPRNAVASAR